MASRDGTGIGHRGRSKTTLTKFCSLLTIYLVGTSFARPWLKFVNKYLYCLKEKYALMTFPVSFTYLVEIVCERPLSRSTDFLNLKSGCKVCFCKNSSSWLKMPRDNLLKVLVGFKMALETVKLYTYSFHINSLCKNYCNRCTSF